MNPVFEAIKNRSSIRAYEQKPVPKDIIDKQGLSLGDLSLSKTQILNKNFFKPLFLSGNRQLNP